MAIFNLTVLFVCLAVVAAQSPSKSPDPANSAGVDVHSHFYSPSYLAALNASGHGQPDRVPFIPVSPLIRYRSITSLMKRTEMVC